MQAVLKFAPLAGAEVARIAGLGSGFAQLGAELFGSHGSSPDAEHFKLRVHATHAGQVIKARDQLAASEISGRSKDNQQTGIADRRRLWGKLLQRIYFDDSRHNSPPEQNTTLV